MKYLIGLDNGGTVIKAALFDETGRQICVASKKIELICPKPGWTERDMEKLWQLNAEAIKRVLELSEIDPKEIAGIGFSGHGKGLYTIDKDGNPFMNGIVSTDNRALDYELEWRRNGTEKNNRETNHQNVLACQPVSLLRWYKDNEPESYKRIGTVFSVKDYIRYRLTGNINNERTDISGSNLLNLETGKYDKNLLKLFGIEEIFDALPPIINSVEIGGRITREAAKMTGLCEGTPAAAGMFDIDACALGMGITDGSDICVIAGTWSINQFISNTPVSDTGIAMNSYYCIPGYFLIEECSPTSAGNLEWILKKFFEKEISDCGGTNAVFYEKMNGLVASVKPESSEIIFMPFLFASNEHPRMKACFLNIGAAASKADILFAVYEGIVFSHKSHVDKLMSGIKKFGAVRLAGGAANSHAWAQMFADVLNIPVKTVADREHGCFGAAMAAGIASGVYKDFAQAAKQTESFSNIFEPDPAKHAIYTQKYKSYRNAVKALASFYEE